MIERLIIKTKMKTKNCLRSFQS